MLLTRWCSGSWNQFGGGSRGAPLGILILGHPEKIEVIFPARLFDRQFYSNRENLVLRARSELVGSVNFMARSAPDGQYKVKYLSLRLARLRRQQAKTAGPSGPGRLFSTISAAKSVPLSFEFPTDMSNIAKRIKVSHSPVNNKNITFIQGFNRGGAI